MVGWSCAKEFVAGSSRRVKANEVSIPICRDSDQLGFVSTRSGSDGVNVGISFFIKAHLLILIFVGVGDEQFTTVHEVR